MARSRLARRLRRFRVFLQFEGLTRRRRSEKLRKAGEAAFAAHLEQAVPDAALRRTLTPDYLLGCKRVLISNDWYPALQRPNVTLRDTPVEAILPEGVRLKGGREMFARRRPLPFVQRTARFLWPRGGWARQGIYVAHRIKRLPGTPNRIAAGFACGVFAVLISAIIVGLALIFTEENFIVVSGLIIAYNIPIMVIEGIVTAMCVAFLRKVRPEMLPGYRG